MGSIPEIGGSIETFLEGKERRKSRRQNASVSLTRFYKQKKGGAERKVHYLVRLGTEFCYRNRIHRSEEHGTYELECGRMANNCPAKACFGALATDFRCLGACVGGGKRHSPQSKRRS